MDRPEMEARLARFARQVAELADQIRPRAGGENPANQLANCASSAAANYRAAGRGRSKREFTAKMGIANEEADETVFWLEHISDSSLAKGLDLAPFHDEARQLRAIIARSYATARRRKA